MAYDALAESVALIESRELDRLPRLSRRNRFVPMSVDVADGVAVTTFARRGVGRVWLDTHVLALIDGHWLLVGGGSGSSTGTPSEDVLADRPATLPANLVPWAPPVGVVVDSILITETGAICGTPNDRSQWISYAHIRADATVHAVAVAGRTVRVPWHGRLAIVWRGRRPPKPRSVDGLGCAAR